MDRFKTVDAYLKAKSEWSEGLGVLREALLAAGLSETVKWGAPCYTHAGRNVVSLAGFKHYFCLWFHEGGSLGDPNGVLQSAAGSKSESMRHWRFTSPTQIKKRVLKAYLLEAMAIAEQPKAKQRKPPSPLVLPAELRTAMQDKKLATAFAALSPGKQREYAEYIVEAKREATRRSRLEKIRPMILAGAGLNDRYRC